MKQIENIFLFFLLFSLSCKKEIYTDYKESLYGTYIGAYSEYNLILYKSNHNNLDTQKNDTIILSKLGDSSIQIKSLYFNRSVYISPNSIMNNKIDIYEAHNIDSLLILKIDDNSLFIKSIYFRNRPFISYLNPFIQIEALKRK